MEEKDRYKIILDEEDGSFAERRMNELAKEGYRFVDMKTSGTNTCLHITIIMEKAD